jgi:hypothetical protein
MLTSRLIPAPVIYSFGIRERALFDMERGASVARGFYRLLTTKTGRTKGDGYKNS